MPNGKIGLPPHSWGMFLTYYKSGTYYGDIVLPPAGWNAYDAIYFSIAVYPSSGCVSLMFTKGSTGAHIHVKVYPPAYGRLSGNVGGLSESDNKYMTGFGNIYVDQIALWAQVLSTGRRNSGPTYVYDSSSPSSVLIYVYRPNVVKLGFSGGTHYPGGTCLWSNTYSGNNEYFPPDP